jgi:carboxypeptidase Q
VTQQNVIAEIRGRDSGPDAVILAAHLDSWELGTGALDNGCNAALVIAAARAIRAATVQPRHTIRFILFTGEEQGLIGSRAYVRQHRADLDHLRAAIVFDTGTGRFTGYSLGGRQDIRGGIADVLAPLASWDIGHHTLDASAGTDNFDFLLEGVPTLEANTEPSNYVATYHAATDTLDKVDFRALDLHVAIAALTAYGIAERVEPLGPRQSRLEIEQLMKRSGLDEELKAIGYWPEWQSGARGRLR